MHWNKILLAASAAASLWTGDLLAGGRRGGGAPCIPCAPNTCVTYNPCGSSYGRMLSYSQALERAEQANVAEAALSETTQKLTAAEARLADLEQQLAAAKAGTDKAVAERDAAMKTATENEAAKMAADDNAAKMAQVAKESKAAADKANAEKKTANEAKVAADNAKKAAEEAKKVAEEAKKVADADKAKAVTAADEATKVAFQQEGCTPFEYLGKQKIVRVTSLNTTRTCISQRTSSGAMPRMLDTMRGPSSSSTSATT